VHDVFTRIRSGATAVVFRRWRAWIYTLLNGDSAHWQWFLARSARNGCKCVGWKTLRVSAYIYKSTAASPTAGWISLQTADSAVAPDSSTFTSRHASSRGLGYFYSTSWVATRLKSNSVHILQDDPSIREEVLDSRLGGSVPRVLRFFLWILRDILAKTSDGPKARWLLHMECDFAIALPYPLRLQDNAGIIEDIQEQHSRTLATT
jgi:hypothetical protein